MFETRKKKNERLLLRLDSLTGLFVISVFSGGASGGVFGGLGGDLEVVFGQFAGQNFEENNNFVIFGPGFQILGLSSQF